MSDYLEIELLNDLKVGLFKYQTKPRKKFIQANKAFFHIVGYSSEEQTPQNHLYDLLAVPKDRGDLLKILADHGNVSVFNTKVLTVKGKIIPVSLSVCLKTEGQREFVEGMMQDLSVCKTNGDFGEKDRNSLQQILDSIPDAIYFKDKKNRITRVNEFYAKGFGGRLDSIIGKTDFDFFPKEQADLMFQDDNYVLQTGKPIVGKVEKSLLPNGSWNQVITTKVPLFDDEGRVIGTMGITRDMTAHANIEQERYMTVLKALTVLNKALEMRDPYTQSHSRYVGSIANMIGKEMKFDDERLLRLKIAAELHDLGKISVPLDILIKPGKLSDLEYSLIKEHTTRCFELMKDIDFHFPLAEIIYQHHERLDGSGYPRQLKGKKILKEARILAVSDVLESMTMHRPYRPALGIKKALQELKRGRGKEYDAQVVDVVLDLVKKNKGEPFWVQQVAMA